ncbi:MAG: putative zinc-binding metallopeptidase [Candidatus Rokuibacteriota bacterium]
MRGFEAAPPDLRALLPQRINDLRLRLEGSPVERYIQVLYRELESKGLRHFRPRCYLTDEWGCPSGEPIIGIPFYLADPKLAQLEREIDDLEDEREIRMYFRHEAGHAFNYAYRLHQTPEWREIFGPFNRPYRERYRPVPFDRSFVRHLEGWYAQKHPDEDFAETFAVWLTPRSQWRTRYKGWPAMRKLRYVDRVARTTGRTEPLVRLASTDITVEEMDMTVEEFFRSMRGEDVPVDVAVENDLPDLFVRPRGRRRGLRPAWELIREHRPTLINKLEYWTGVRRSVVRALVERIEEAAERLNLYVEADRERSSLVELTAYASTLAMSHLVWGSFTPRLRRRPRRPTPATGGRKGERDGTAADRGRSRS